jgi:hypothetical protein
MGVSFGSRWNSLDGEQKTRHQSVGRQPYWLCLGSRNSPGATKFDKLKWICSHRLYNAFRICPGCRSQLIKPSELAFRANFKTVNVSVSISQMITESGCCFDFVMDLSGYCYLINRTVPVRVCPTIGICLVCINGLQKPWQANSLFVLVSSSLIFNNYMVEVKSIVINDIMTIGV